MGKRKIVIVVKAEVNADASKAEVEDFIKAALENW